MTAKAIVISGASSGIGAALARQLAKPGRTLALIGRNAERLDSVAAACAAKGARSHTVAIDVCDQASLFQFVDKFEEKHGIDFLIANAGILDGRHGGQALENAEIARRVIETNLLASIDLIHRVLPGMRRRKAGDIALVASLASLVPLPDAPAYSASKAGLMSYGLALREAIAPEGIRVTVACPGFVKTAMADIHCGPRPGEVSADVAARRILLGVQRNVALTGFPLAPFWLSRLSLLAPEWLRRLGMRGSRFHVE